MKPSLAVLAVVAVVAVLAPLERERAPAQAPAPSPSAAAPSSVQVASVRRHLRALADVAGRAGGNRAAGTPGDRATAEYVTGVLEDAGWRVQSRPVRFPFFDVRRPPRVRLPGGASLRPGRDVRAMTYSGSGSVSARVRAVGLRPGRASAAGCHERDFDALRAGEIAVVQRGTCTLRRKALNAHARGAVAVLIPNDGLPGRTEAIRGTLGSPGVRIPVLALSTAAGQRVARARRATVSLTTTSERRSTVNVIAETGDGERVAMAGGHLDSVPAGPGMNDNGSGVAALLAVAETLPGRVPEGATVRIGLWGAEELGLIGARRYVRGLGAAARRAIRGYVNLDMVGTRGRRPAVYAGDARIQRALRSGLRRRGRDRVRRRPAGSSSDHVPFRSRGIPIGGVFTGLDRCYHRRCDRLGNVDAELVADVADATRTTLLAMARRR